MPATIARWTGTQISLSAMTRATPTGSCSGVTGCTRFPTPPRTAPTIAEPPPILNTHCCSLMAVPGPVPPDSPLRSCHGPGAGGSCARGVLLAGGEQLVQQWLHLGHRQGEGTEPAGQRAADVPARRRDHVAVAAVPDDRVGDASPTGDGAGGQPRRDGVEVPAAPARPGHRPGRCCQRLEPAERGLAGGGVQVEHVEHRPGGEPDVGLRVAPPPGPDLGAVGGRVGEPTRRQGVLAGLRAAWLPARAPQGAPPLPPPAAGDGGVVQRNHGNALLGVRQGAVEQGGVTPPMTHRNPSSKRHVPSRCGETSKWRGRAGPPSPRALARPCPPPAVPVGDLREVVRHTARWPGWSPRGWAPGAAWSPVGAGQRRDGGVGDGLAAHARLRWGWGRPNIALALDGYGGPRGTSTQPTDNAGLAGQRAVRWGMRG